MTTMLKKAAEALAKCLELTCRSGEEVETADDLRNAESDIGHLDCYQAVLAVLHAIREPSEGMNIAGDDVIFGVNLDGARETWQAMLDHIIAEQEA